MINPRRKIIEKSDKRRDLGILSRRRKIVEIEGVQRFSSLCAHQSLIVLQNEHALASKSNGMAARTRDRTDGKVEERFGPVTQIEDRKEGIVSSYGLVASALCQGPLRDEGAQLAPDPFGLPEPVLNRVKIVTAQSTQQPAPLSKITPPVPGPGWVRKGTPADGHRDSPKLPDITFPDQLAKALASGKIPELMVNHCRQFCLSGLLEHLLGLP